MSSLINCELTHIFEGAIANVSIKVLHGNIEPVEMLGFVFGPVPVNLNPQQDSLSFFGKVFNLC